MEYGRLYIMLELADFQHLPELEAAIAHIAADDGGLVVVAGVDMPAPAAVSAGFPPSGRATFFRVLMRELLAARPAARALVVTETKDTVRVPRPLRGRMRVLDAPQMPYTQRIELAAVQRPDLLVVEKLEPEALAPILDAAAEGMRVLTQFETIFMAADVLTALADLGAAVERLPLVHWVVSAQRVRCLCSHCSVPVSPSAAEISQLRLAFGELSDEVQAGRAAVFRRAAGCPHCNGTGHDGEIALFDVYRHGAGQDSAVVLSLYTYALHLALVGQLSLDDLLALRTNQARRMYAMLAASQRALRDANAALQRRLIEVESAQHISTQRTEALVSFQRMGEALLGAVELPGLAEQACRHARDLCGADRVILYYLRPGEEAEVLAFVGWDPQRVPKRVPAAAVCTGEQAAATQPVPFRGWPPGITSRSPDVEGAVLRAGLRVPLVAQGQQVGAMIVHSTVFASFQPGQVALLQTFAAQAALAFQRAGLIDELQAKIAALQAAQAELAVKERMERELELARQVQQSFLPKSFPQVPSHRIAAANEPARQVGGDFYDVIPLEGGRAGLVIADVSDKGMPAALYMALTRSLIRAEAHREASPAAVLANVNRLLLELGEPGMFVSVFYGVIYAQAHTLTYARAGHDRPVLLRSGQATELGGNGLILGLFEDLTLTEETVRVEPGDRLVLYTDGLTDASNEAGEMFGLDRLLQVFARRAEESPDAMCRGVFDDLAAYRGNANPYDDMTLLVVSVEAHTPG
jgi:serine phosphatase RsbU (regulator of sigma subunit)